MSYSCQICRDSHLNRFPEFSTLPRITSDCRPFRKGSELAFCGSCGAIQKLPSPQWFADIGDVYRDYYAYFQAEGAEQIVFDARTGQVRFRSDVLLERLAEAIPVKDVGAALDIGCGTGVTLMSLSSRFPRYRLFGQDLDRRNEERLRRIPCFEGLHTAAPRDVPGIFDVVTLIHSIEHFPEPLAVLASIRSKLAGDGVLLVEVCDVERNPFDLLIVDHLMHFSAHTLRLIIEEAGLGVSILARDWISKELSCVAQAADGVIRKPGAHDARVVSAMVSRSLDWLRQMVDAARSSVNRFGKIGIFGTSIAGTWLAGSIPQGCAFFVDEDPNRVGRTHMGKPILAPQDVDDGSAVFLALTPAVADTIAGRLQGLPIRLIRPPAIDLN